MQGLHGDVMRMIFGLSRHSGGLCRLDVGTGFSTIYYHNHHGCRALISSPFSTNREEPTAMMVLIVEGKVYTTLPILLDAADHVSMSRGLISRWCLVGNEGMDHYSSPNVVPVLVLKTHPLIQKYVK